MDTATAAGMADPDKNPMFRRQWCGPPERKRRPCQGAASKLNTTPADQIICADRSVNDLERVLRAAIVQWRATRRAALP